MNKLLGLAATVTIALLAGCSSSSPDSSLTTGTPYRERLVTERALYANRAGALSSYHMGATWAGRQPRWNALPLCKQQMGGA
jgi:hypothetical protein